MSYAKQSGVTLLELLIALGVGSIVVGSVTTVYVSTVTSTNDMLRSSKLNQELAALTTVMTNDIRRAGYWGNMALEDYATPNENPFAQLDNTALEVHAANVQQAATGSGECIIYTYDADLDGVLDNEDIRGFRLSNGVVQMREHGNLGANMVHDSCNDPDDEWADVTDGQLITITALTFNLGSSICLNTDEPDGEEDGGDAAVVDDDEERNCYTIVPGAGSGDITVETREVNITITGTLAADASVTATLTQDVRVRNDLVQVR